MLIAQLDPEVDLAQRLAAAQQLAGFGVDAAAAVPVLVECLGTDHQAMRTAATYALGAIGEPAVAPLAKALRAAGREADQHEAPPAWNEGATNMEDAAQALAAVGEPAVEALCELLDDESEWTQVNAAFALGEMDSHAVAAVPALTRSLEDGSHRLVRTALVALGNIAQGVPVEALGQMLSADHPNWQEEAGRRWVPRDQVRTNAAIACAQLGQAAAPLEPQLFRALDDSCGHVGAFALSALQQIGSPTATQAAMDYLYSQRWDAAIDGERQF